MAITCILLIFLISTPTASAKIIDVDGDSSDWAGISQIITDPDDFLHDQLDVDAVYVTNDEKYIYFRIDVIGLIFTGGYYRIFIDVDQDPATGMGFFGIGAEYQVGLYNGYGSGIRTADYSSFTVQAAYSGSCLELRVARVDLGYPSIFDFIVYCNPSDTAYPLGTYTIANDQSITVDGNLGDWAGSPFFTDATGDAVSSSLDLTECYVGSDGTNLFAMMKTDGAIDSSTTGQVFIYVDGNMLGNFYGTIGVGWTVWEGSKALSVIGVNLGDEIYLVFYLTSSEGDVAPNEGYETYRIVEPVGGVVIANNSIITLGLKVGIGVTSILCVAITVMLFKKSKH